MAPVTRTLIDASSSRKETARRAAACRAGDAGAPRAECYPAAEVHEGESALSGRPSIDPVVVCGADEEYAIGLAVTIQSVLHNLAPERRLHAYLIDGGMRPWTRRQLVRSWDPARVDVTFLRPDLGEVRRMPVSDYVSHSTYLRLILPEVVPRSESRAIYLDSDVVVEHDLGALWDEPFDGNVVLAAQDVGFPVLDAAKGLANFAACKPYLTGERPIPNYVELGLPPEAPYFNGGVLVVDLARWRAEGLTERMLRCLQDNRAHALHWDQYALNVVLCGRWGRLDLRWNAATAIRQYPNAEVSPFSAEEYRNAIEAPWVIHYVGAYKPWYWGRRGLYQKGRNAFAPYYDQVDWPRWLRWRWTLLPVAREGLAKRRRRFAKWRSRVAGRLRRAGRTGRARAVALVRRLAPGAGERR